MNGAALHSEFDRDLNEANGPTQTEIQTLTEQRHTTPHRNTTERRRLSKLIQREVKAQKKIKRRAQINTILANFKGLKQIASIKTRQKHKRITHMVDDKGREVTDRTELANIFADFYTQVYASCAVNAETSLRIEPTASELNPETFQSFTKTELEQELKGLRNNRCKDSSGLVAEMLKGSGEVLTDILLDMFNQIASGAMLTPQTWNNLLSLYCSNQETQLDHKTTDLLL